MGIGAGKMSDQFFLRMATNMGSKNESGAFTLTTWAHCCMESPYPVKPCPWIGI